MADKMMRIAGRGIDGTAKAIHTDNDGKITVSERNKFNSLIQKQVTFAGKTRLQTYDNPHIAKTVTNHILIEPVSLKGLGAGEISQSDYDLISSENGTSRNSVTATVGKTQIFYFLVNVVEEAKKTRGIQNDINVADLRSLTKKISVKYKGYGSGSNAGVQTWGIALRAYNRVTLVWDVIGSNTASEPEFINANLNTSDYVDDTGFMYIAAMPAHLADATITSGNYTDFVKLDFVFEGAMLNSEKTPTIADFHLESFTLAPGQSAFWGNVDVSDCEQYAISVNTRPNILHNYTVTATPIGSDNVAMDEPIKLIDGQFGIKTSERITIKTPKVAITIKNNSAGTYTYTGKLLKYGKIAAASTVTTSMKIVGKREADGLEGLAMSFVLDENNIPIQRVVNAAPHGFDVGTDSIKVLPVNNPKVVVETIASIVPVASGAVHKAGFSSMGEDETWVLINSDKTGWTATANVGAWAPVVAEVNLSSALYPKRENITTNTSNINFPLRSLLVTANNDAAIPYDTYERAYAHRNTSDNVIYVTNNNATDSISLTVRIMRVWR